MKERKYKEEYVLESYVDERGREKRRAVYRGSYYHIAAQGEARKKLNLYAVGSCVLFVLFYLIYMKLSTPSAWCMYVLPVAAAALIPLYYWCMGLFSMLRAPEKMTRTQRENGIGRVMRSAMGCMILMFIALVGDVVFLARGASFSAEWPGFAVLLCAAMTATGAFRYVKGHYNAVKETAPKGGSPE